MLERRGKLSEKSCAIFDAAETLSREIQVALSMSVCQSGEKVENWLLGSLDCKGEREKGQKANQRRPFFVKAGVIFLATLMSLILKVSSPKAQGLCHENEPFFCTQPDKLTRKA